MKTMTFKIVTVSFTMAVLLGAVVRAGGTARFESIPDKSKVTVDGTSTLHDWTVKSPNISGSITFKFDVPADAPVQLIRERIVANPDADVDVTIKVKSLVSGDKAMDKKMYEALKSDDNPSITYKLTKLELAAGTKAEQSKFEVKTSGKLTIAGTTKDLEMSMVLEVVDSQHLRISGETPMKMTTYNVKPPTALAGMIKSADKIKVTFEWNSVRVAATPPATQPASPAK
jgi:hypothetical protein